MTPSRGLQRSVGCLATLLSVLACSDVPRPVCVAGRTEYVMGTLLDVWVEADDTLTAARAIDTAFAVVRRLDRLLSNYDSASELTRIGREAPRPVHVSPETMNFVLGSLALARQTNGTVDFTVAPVVRLWGFYGERPAVPNASTLARAGACVGIRKVGVDTLAGTVRLDSGMALDPGAAGKGFALAEADRATAWPAVQTVNFNFGGQVFRRGREAVEYAVQHPRDDSTVVSLIRFASGSLATSGDTERFFESEGRRFGHIIDPRTLQPVERRGAVSVWHPDPFLADALATALFILGPDSCFDVLARFPDAAVLFVESQADSLVVRTNSAWDRMESP